jgi:ribulose 1,5-bisphosphate synthetase/thiazole synthase
MRVSRRIADRGFSGQHDNKEETMLIVIGGDAAGMSAASQVRRLQPEADITVFERGPHTSYSA